MMRERVRPNHRSCEGCPDFDDINGCWAGYDNWLDCSWMPGEEYGDEDYPDFGDPSSYCPNCGKFDEYLMGDLCSVCEAISGGVEDAEVT